MDIVNIRNLVAVSFTHFGMSVIFYASAQRSVAGAILFLSCSSVCRPETLLIYFAEYLTHFHQTCFSDALWVRDERLKIWGQKVKDQGHGGIKYAGNSTFWAYYHDS